MSEPLQSGSRDILFIIESLEVQRRHTIAGAFRDEQIELAKLAVSPAAHGRGLGRRLSETVIHFARNSGARRVILVSSTKLVAAVRLYESLGFRRAPMPSDVSYETADVYMELDLETEI